MRDAVIVSVARTPIGRAYRGAFNATPATELAAHAIGAAVARAGVAGDEIDGRSARLRDAQGIQVTIARNAVLRAGLPVGVPAMTLDGSARRA